LTYTPAANFAGDDSFTFKVTDGLLDSAPATVSLTVSPPAYYSGSFVGAITGADPAHSGTIKINALGTGAFTGSLKYGGVTYTLKGRFDASGQYRATLTRKGSPTLTLTFSSGLLNGQDAIFGTVSNAADSVSSAITATNAIYSKTKPAPEAGSYTAVIPPDATQTDPAAAPQGYGAATLNVRRTGAMTFAGTLADGTKFTRGATLTRNATWYLFLPLYAKSGPGLGMLQGTIQFDATSAGTDLEGLLTWVKPANAKAVTNYKNGFTLQTSLRGSAYDSAGSTGLTQGSGNTFHAAAGNLVNPINEPATATGGARSFKVTGDHALSLTVTLSSGLVTGAFKHPDTNLSAPVRAVIYQKSTPAIFGNFTTTLKTDANEAGSITLTTP
jgi:hypothetical protein